MKNDGYLGNERLKKVGVELSFTEEQLREIIKCTDDPVYFIRNYVKIVNVDKGLVPFDMWKFQEDMVFYMLQKILNIQEHMKLPQIC